MKNILELNEQEVSEFIDDICLNANITDDANLEENLTDFATWVENTLNNATLLSMIYKGNIDVDYKPKEGFIYSINETFRSLHPDILPSENNPVWQQISDLLDKRSFE